MFSVDSGYAKKFQELYNKMKSFSNEEEALAWLDTLTDEEREMVLSAGGKLKAGNSFYDEWYNRWKTYHDYQNVLSGDSSANEFLGSHSLGLSDFITPTMQTYLDNKIAQENTKTAQDFEEHMRDTSALSTAAQYQQLGLSPSVIAQTGSIGSNGVSAAQTSMKNNAQERAMQKYQERYGLARQLISMTGSMASSGIYGAALNMAKKSASTLASAASHSGLKALSSFNSSNDNNWSQNWDNILKELGSM